MLGLPYFRPFRALLVHVSLVAQRRGEDTSLVGDKGGDVVERSALGLDVGHSSVVFAGCLNVERIIADRTRGPTIGFSYVSVCGSGGLWRSGAAARDRHTYHLLPMRPPRCENLVLD